MSELGTRSASATPSNTIPLASTRLLPNDLYPLVGTQFRDVSYATASGPPTNWLGNAALNLLCGWLRWPRLVDQTGQFFLKGNFMMEELACKNPAIRIYSWNSTVERMSSEENFL